MKLISGFQESDLFRKMIILSLLLHASFVLFSLVKTFIFPSERIEFENAIRVDIVGLPEKTMTLPEEEAPKLEAEPKEEEKAPPPPVAEEKPEPKPKPDTISLKKNPNRNEALDKVRELMKEEKRRQEIARIAKEVAEENTKKRQVIKDSLVKGNVISAGTSLKGREKYEFNEYIGLIHDQVRKNWSLPEWLKKDDLTVRIVVHIDFRGVVVRKYVDKSSGNSQYDAYAMDAVEKSLPLPAPPAKFVDIVKQNGIVLGFPE